MKDKLPSNMDFEKWMAQQLNKVQAAPNEDTWAQIAARQNGPNRWLRLRHYGRFALPVIALLILGLSGWWYRGASSNQTLPQPETERPDIHRRELSPENKPPVAAVLPAPEEGFVYAPQKPFIPKNKPRFTTRLNTVPAAAVRFRAEAGLDYESPVSGTRVKIPPASLVNARGLPVRGEVELVFREYRGVADYLASGIPMHYTDGRGSFFFNSGGMFEVRINQNGETLEMAPGQTYDLSFAPTHELENASLYYLDDVSGEWGYQPDPAFRDRNGQVQAALPPTVTETEAARDNKNANLANCLSDPPALPADDSPAEWVKTAVQTGFDLAEGKIKMPLWFRKNPTLKKEQLMNGMERGQIRIVRHRDLAELFFPEDMSNVFTELKAFKDCYFVRMPDSLRRITIVNNSESWNRISIYQETGALCHFWLYGEQGLLEFTAKLTPSTGNENFDADKIMSEYKRLRDEREHNFDKLVSDLHRFITIAPAFQTPEELCMTAPEWLNWFEENRPMMQKRYAALIKAGLADNNTLAGAAWDKWRSRLRNQLLERRQRTAQTVQTAQKGLEYALKLTRFGIYNCDQIFRLGRQSDYIYAAFNTPKGDRVYAASISVLERNSRMFFTLPYKDKLLYAPDSRLDIVLTDFNGRNYHLPAEQYAGLDFAGMAGGGIRPVIVEDVTDKTGSPRDWAELLNM